MEDEELTTYFKKNPSRVSMNTCLPSSLICVTGESYIPLRQRIISLFYHKKINKVFPSLCLSLRESEDTALLLLKEIYDKLGVPFEQPQQ